MTEENSYTNLSNYIEQEREDSKKEGMEKGRGSQKRSSIFALKYNLFITNLKGNSMVHLTKSDLLSRIELASKEIEVGGVYAHYRSPEIHYTVVALAILEATEEPAVVYKNGSLVWVRAVSSWLEEVPLEGGSVSRFQKVLTKAFSEL